MQSYKRGIIKWQPFNSVMPSQKIMKDLIKQRNKIKSPILSEEQKKEIEKKLIIAYYEKVKIKIKFYARGQIMLLEDSIKKIDSTYHKIYFNNITLLFEQIVEIL